MTEFDLTQQALETIQEPKATPTPKMYGLSINPLYANTAELAQLLNVMQIQIPANIYDQLPQELKRNFVEC